MIDDKKIGYYFDYAAATPVDQRVLKTMNPNWYIEYGNPSSLHRHGRYAKDKLRVARGVIAKSFGVKDSTIYFTSGGTESDNLAIFGVTASISKKRKIMVSAIEHKAVLHPLRYLERNGWQVDVCPVDNNGILVESEFEKLIDKDTVLISVIYANNEIGVVQDISKLVKIAKRKNNNVIFHTDACQAVNYLDIDVKKLGVDLLSFAASKIYGPKGVGGLYVNGNVHMTPMIWGGGQESGLRAGTENIAGIVGMSEAIKIARMLVMAENKRLQYLRDKIIYQVSEKISDTILNGHIKQRLPNIINFSIAGIEGESLVLYLDNEGFYCSTGSACGASDLDPSHVLLALGRDKTMAHGSLRISLGRWSNEESVDKLLNILPRVVEKLRKISAI